MLLSSLSISAHRRWVGRVLLLVLLSKELKKIEHAHVWGYFDICVSRAVRYALEGSARLDMHGDWPWLPGGGQLCVPWCCWEMGYLGWSAFVP